MLVEVLGFGEQSRVVTCRSGQLRGPV